QGARSRDGRDATGGRLDGQLDDRPSLVRREGREFARTAVGDEAANAGGDAAFDERTEGDGVDRCPVLGERRDERREDAFERSGSCHRTASEWTGLAGVGPSSRAAAT